MAKIPTLKNVHYKLLSDLPINIIKQEIEDLNRMIILQYSSISIEEQIKKFKNLIDSYEYLVSKLNEINFLDAIIEKYINGSLLDTILNMPILYEDLAKKGIGKTNLVKSLKILSKNINTFLSIRLFSSFPYGNTRIELKLHENKNLITTPNIKIEIKKIKHHENFNDDKPLERRFAFIYHNLDNLANESLIDFGNFFVKLNLKGLNYKFNFTLNDPAKSLYTILCNSEVTQKFLENNLHLVNAIIINEIEDNSNKEILENHNLVLEDYWL